VRGVVARARPATRAIESYLTTAASPLE